MSIVRQLIRRIRAAVSGDPRFSKELFTDYKYVFGHERACHALTVDLIHEAAKQLKRVASVTGNKTIRKGMRPQWKPDIVLRDASDAPIAVVEYESLNSSDARVFDKDVWGYYYWMEAGGPRVPFLIITTLPDFLPPGYQLRYTRASEKPGASQWNWEPCHRERLLEIKSNPFLYWYKYYRRRMEEDEWDFPVTFANFSGNRLTIVNIMDQRFAPQALDAESPAGASNET